MHVAMGGHTENRILPVVILYYVPNLSSWDMTTMPTESIGLYVQLNLDLRRIDMFSWIVLAVYSFVYQWIEALN